ncbi:cytochrome P450 302a1, mitochondrial [Onthophagus taurus]|uniref:cytochrome P450 302a1, mitochondrial n=1 Tax=Onthophagus taurus TaxID=166361 RepID=UPI0039BE191D
MKRKLSTILNSRIKSFEEIPGPFSIPILGTLYQYFPVIGRYKFDRLQRNGMEKYQRYGQIVREQIIPGINLVWLFNPDDIQTIFRNEGKYPQRRSHLALKKYRLDRPMVYNTGGLLPTNGSDWLRLRSIFQKGLSSPKAVENFLPISNQVVQEWVLIVKDLSKKESFDYLPQISRLFLELTGVAAFDIRLDSFSKQELHPNSRSSKLIKAPYTSNSCILKLDNGPQLWKKFDTPLYKKFKKAQIFMEEVAIDLLSIKLSLFQENGPQTKSLLESYLSSPNLDFKDVIGFACDFLLAGIDTSTYTTSFILYHLAKNPQSQQKLYEESLKLLPSPFSAVTKEILSQAYYAKAVLKESLRLRPISVGVGRILEKDTVLSGYNVPKETVIITQNQIACRLETNFPNPNDFIPERWIKEHEFYKPIHPFLVLPFGHGARSCIARRLAEQNMLIVIMKLIRCFEIGWSGPDLDTKSLLINKPDGSITLTFKSRQGRKIE